MRILPIIGVVSLVCVTSAHAEPTTVECLGNLDRLLSCPPGAQLVDHGSASYCATQNGFDSWPPASRNGPSVWFQHRKPGVVHRAGYYKDHKKHGRTLQIR